MNVTNQQTEKTETAPVISPLANDKTYGERWYRSIFDIGLNYWTNLTASAAFSQWAEHGTRPVWWLKNQSPRDWQANVSQSIKDKDPFMNGKIPFTTIDNPLTFMKGYKHKVYSERDERIEKIKQRLDKPEHSGLFEGDAKKKEELIERFTEKFNKRAEFEIGERAMARARSLILLIPGFAVVIPTVWIGAKIKPWFVKTVNKMHYGDEAMSDPTMVARQQAIEAEARPTFLGTIVARLGTVVAAQATAQTVGSKNNFINKLGKNNSALADFGVDSTTEKLGETIGGALPKSLQNKLNKMSINRGLEASEHQIRKTLIAEKKIGRHDLTISDEHRAFAKEKLGDYKTATQDIGRFVMADTFYTAVTALTIHPLVKLLRHVPGMSYKPKMPKNAAYFDGETVQSPLKIKVPANQYGDLADRAPDASTTTPQTDTPNLSVSDIAREGKLEQREQQIA